MLRKPSRSEREKVFCSDHRTEKGEPMEKLFRLIEAIICFWVLEEERRLRETSTQRVPPSALLVDRVGNSGIESKNQMEARGRTSFLKSDSWTKNFRLLTC